MLLDTDVQRATCMCLAELIYLSTIFVVNVVVSKAGLWQVHFL